MSVFDYIIEQLLEILRLSIYRYAGRAVPARKGRARDQAVEAEAPRRVEKKKAARRRKSGWNNLLLWVAIIVIGGIVYRRLMQRRS
ncbi:MAG: hypothetical protein JNK29_17040 [Anaerolineales bacterium]|nr:hypothetical protein [Anaerolineales bacterium]